MDLGVRGRLAGEGVRRPAGNLAGLAAVLLQLAPGAVFQPWGAAWAHVEAL